MNWDIKINEEIDLLRETVRQFAEKNIFPIADEIDKKNEFPQHLWTEPVSYTHLTLPTKA